MLRSSNANFPLRSCSLKILFCLTENITNILFSLFHYESIKSMEWKNKIKNRKLFLNELSAGVSATHQPFHDYAAHFC